MGDLHRAVAGGGAGPPATANPFPLFQFLIAMKTAPAKITNPQFLWAVFFTAVVALCAACALPDNRYLRFLSLTDSAVVKARWIYERIHFDPAPIDIVFIGTSHSVFGI